MGVQEPRFGRRWLLSVATGGSAALIVGVAPVSASSESRRGSIPSDGTADSSYAIGEVLSPVGASETLRVRVGAAEVNAVPTDFPNEWRFTDGDLVLVHPDGRAYPFVRQAGDRKGNLAARNSDPARERPFITA